MNKKFCFLLYGLLAGTLSVFAQPRPIRLIVRGDDMGFSHAGNEALIKTYRDGIERSIEVLVPSPWFPEAVALLKQNPGVDVGVHLALTSEWESVKWRPLTHCPSLTDSNGYFYPMIWPNKNYGQDKALKGHPWKLEEIEKEFRAQIETAIRNIPRISHISAHMGCTRLDNQVNNLVKELIKEYKIAIDPEELGVKSIGYQGPTTTPGEKLTSFIRMIDSLQAGETYLFVDHPALESPEMRAIYHTGYENVSQDRQGVTDVWTNPQVKAALKKRGVRLINYADLIRN